MIYVLFAVLVMQISAFIIGDHIKRLQNDGRKTDQSEEDFNMQVKRWNKVQSALQCVASVCLILYLLYTKGII